MVINLWGNVLADKPHQPSARYLALQGLLSVMLHGQSLSQVLDGIDHTERSYIQALLMASLRHYTRLDALIHLLIQKPFKRKDQDLHQLLILSLAQLEILQQAEHAVVNEAVALTHELHKDWAKGLINGVLRNYLRQREQLAQQLPQDWVVQTSHPQWLIQQLKQSYRGLTADILAANNLQPPVHLRLNPLRVSPAMFYQALHSAQIPFTPCEEDPHCLALDQSQNITQLPGFAQGWFSVQNRSAQWAARLIAPRPGEKILDACAAPGGKTAHLAELSQGQAQIFAIEKDPQRFARLQQNLQRLGHGNLTFWCQDALDPLPENQQFDAILLDAPCSATGIIRRHPDIKYHRREEDIPTLSALQTALLNHLWSTLKAGGRLLYATCSVLPQENIQVIEAFLAQTPNAQAQQLHLPAGRDEKWGWQILPQGPWDGFFYALLQKADVE